jgi:translation initiation factor 2D
VRDGQLPLAGGKLWNTFLLPGRRAGTHLDLKASSHKKLSKLLQVASRHGPPMNNGARIVA